MNASAVHILGIVNLTDNSFFSASRSSGAQAAARALQMAAEGADVIDLGPCSSRPGAEPVGPEEEWRRLEPVLEALKGSGLRISVDTSFSEVVRRACACYGEILVNDISAGEDDPQMLETVSALGLGYIAMHKRGTPQTMQDLTDYPDGVVRGVLDYFTAFARRADAAGVRDWMLDPGFGFAKTVEQNWTLLRGLSALQVLGRPLLVGLSRKSMLWKPLHITPEEALTATQVAQFAALQQGARWLRVHDVAQARQTVRLFRLWKGSEQEEGGQGKEEITLEP